MLFILFMTALKLLFEVFAPLLLVVFGCFVILSSIGMKFRWLRMTAKKPVKKAGKGVVSVLYGFIKSSAIRTRNATYAICRRKLNHAPSIVLATLAATIVVVVII